MDYTIDFDAPAEKIYQDFTTHEYWEFLMDSYRSMTTPTELIHFSCDDTGIDIVLRQHLPKTFLPEATRAVVPVDLVITREQHFDSYDHSSNGARGRFGSTGTVGHVSGQYYLTEKGAGSQLRIATVCKINIPFIGGTFERLILNNINQLFDAEEAFTADWIAKHR
jgi:Protein of unknown function (DUF2505)